VTPYASTLYFTDDDSEPSGALDQVLADGFDAAKIRIGRSVDVDTDRVALARDVLGPDCTLMVDVNRQYDAATAVEVADAIAPYDVAWLEEPVAPTDLAGYRTVRERTDIPVAGGEAATDFATCDRLVSDRAVDIIQPDLCRCGGLTVAQDVAAAAAASHVAVTPHCWMGAIGLTASLHFAGSLPTPPPESPLSEPLIEVDRADNPLRDDLLVTPLDLTGGSVPVPADPGLGITVDESALDRYRID
jgi:D-galactarolactone cycloisomerase